MVALMLNLFGNPIISGLLGILIGTLLGHQFSLGRDKRKEFNLATKKIRIDALNQLETMKGEVLGIPVSSKDILDLRATIGEKRSKKITSAFKAYAKAHGVVRVADEDALPFTAQKTLLDKVPEYKCKLNQLILALEPK